MGLQEKKLKICVSSGAKDLEGEIDVRFGRSEYFLIISVEKGKICNFEVVENLGSREDRGAGIKAAEQVGSLGVDLVITGDVGPKALDVLKQLDIDILKASGSIKKVIDNYLVADLGDSDKQKLFIPLMNNNGEESEVALHFGHAPYFGIYNLNNKELFIEENKLDHGDAQKSPVDQILEQANPSMVFAQDMGSRAISLFAEKNIVLKTGPYKNLKEIIDNIDNLEDLSSSCGH